MENNRPHITRAPGGEYSTVRLPNGVIETMWFGDDKSQRLVGRTRPESLATVAAQHIATDPT
jgi:hypothetical protein